MKNFFKSILNVGSVGLLFQGTVVNFQPLSDTSGTNLSGPLGQFMTGSGNLAQFFQAVFTFALSVGAILAVLRLAYAGWLYMSSDAFGKKSHAKEVITDAILGLLLLIGIYIVLYQINPCLLNLNIAQTIQSGSSASCPSS